MLEQIKEKLKEEEVQRAILKAVGATAVFITSYAFNQTLNGVVNSGIDGLLKKWHPTTKVPAE